MVLKITYMQYLNFFRYCVRVSFLKIYEKKAITSSLISFQNMIKIAINEPKLEMISKFKVLNRFVLKIFLNKYIYALRH